MLLLNGTLDVIVNKKIFQEQLFILGNFFGNIPNSISWL
ncbi:hypothetical protein LM80661_50262 [Listeria monocytogenes]|nr:hypothetical protein LM80661_50262 [Listeria monocytogenes]CUL91157.1 hypothetical protein LM900335_50351 [Listeria monocytogenes]